MSATPPPERLCEELLSILGTGSQIDPFSRRYPAFGLADAYEVVERVRHRRSERGEHPVGRKIGFTNRSLWAGYGISAPIWNYVFNSTVEACGAEQGSVGLRGLPEPRIEPEVVLHLASAPEAGMSASDLAVCVDWAAPGFEVVHSPFPGWDFSAADAAAAFGVHGALFVGAPQPLPESPSEIVAQLSAFTVALAGPGGVQRQGHAKNVLGGPLEALRFLVEDLARFPGCAPLSAGEIVTTGTLTEAMPLEPGQAWTASFAGIDFQPLALRTG